MFDEESYHMSYLYNAVAEYIFFVINLIQDSGPKDLKNIEHHMKFFKEDIKNFIQIFEGNDSTEKTGMMLCTTSNAFILKDGTLYLSNMFTRIKHSIYTSILVIKTADLILKGVYFIKDICHNLNLSHVTAVQEDFLLLILKQTPYFHVTSHSSVIIRQLHGLITFDNHVYRTIIKYFLSLLLNVKSLSYSMIKIHSKCVPSCGIRDSLVVFCTLHICKLFKCKNGTVRLKKKLQTKVDGNQILNIKNYKNPLKSEPIPIAVLICKVHGSILKGWIGEILNVKAYMSVIQCLISFTNGCQGTFEVYFDKSALKSLCEISDLRNCFSACDMVEFDAQFCNKGEDQGIFWKATRVKSFKQELQINLLNLKTDLETMDMMNYYDFRRVTKTCSAENCSAEFVLLEKVPKTFITRSQKQNSTSDLNERILDFMLSSLEWLKHFQNGQESLIHNLQELKTEIKYSSSIVSVDNKSTSARLLIHKCSSDICLECYQSDEYKCKILEENDSIKIKNSAITITKNGFTGGNVLLYRDNGILEKLLLNEKWENVFKTIFHRNISISGKVQSDAYQENLDGDHIYSFKLFLCSTFMFGEIISTSENDGLAMPLQSNAHFKIFFQNNAILFQNGNKVIPLKGSLGLFFIPCIEQVSVANLAYLLNKDETVAVLEKSTDIHSFVTNSLFPKIKMSIQNDCNCNFTDNLLVNTSVPNLKNHQEKMLQIYKFVKHLYNVYSFDNTTLNNFHSLINLLHIQNKIDSKNLTAFMCALSVKVSSVIQSHKICKLRQGIHRSLYLYKKKCGIQFFKTNTLNNFKSLLMVALKSRRYKKLKFPNKDNINILPAEGHGKFISNFLFENKLHLGAEKKSCSSISSYASCHSVCCSSEDKFHSCESLSDVSPSNSKTGSLENVFLPNTVNEFSNNHQRYMPSNSIEKGLIFNGATQIPGINVDNLENNSIMLNKNEKKYPLLYLSRFKHTKKKSRIVLPAVNHFCKHCNGSLLKTIARVSILTKSNLFLKVENELETFTLCFPIRLIPIEMQQNVKLNSIVKIAIIPHVLMNLSHVLYLDLT